MKIHLLIGFLTCFIALPEGAVLPKDQLDPLSEIDTKAKDLEVQVMKKAKEIKAALEEKLWGLHDDLENRVREVVRHLEHDCRKKALTYLLNALEEVEMNGEICTFAKALARKMKTFEEEAGRMVKNIRKEAQDLKLKHIPCLNPNNTAPYCKKMAASLDRLSAPAHDFISDTSRYFAGDYDRFLVECFDKTAFEMKVQAGIVESQKCKGI